jgi:CHAT domain-containing protein/tetratricopeptide (TPR) repeat protein
MTATLLGRTLSARGDYAGARALQERALKIREAKLGKDHPFVAISLNNVAFLLMDQGDYAGARPLLERSLAIHETAYGKDHPEVLSELYSLPLVLQALGRNADARALADRALELSQFIILQQAPILPERQQFAQLESLEIHLDRVLSLSVGDRKRDAHDYRRVLAWKGLTAEAQAVRRGGAVEGPARSLLAEVAGARVRLQRLTQQPVPTGTADEPARALRRAVGELEAKEEALARAVGWKPILPKPEQVAEALPADAALVDLIEYTHAEPPAKGRRRFDYKTRYAAFVVRHGAQPRRVELGPASEIEEALAAWRARLQREGGDPEEAGRRVAGLVWRPLEPVLEGAHTVLVAPEGGLNFLPWGALPDKEPGSFLLQRYAFAVVGSGRQLVLLTGSRSAPAAGGLLAVGGVDYGQAEDRAKPDPGAPPRIASRRRAATVTRGGLSFDALPATKAEAETVAKLYRRRRPREKISYLEGRQATRDRLHGAMAGRRYLHLATHGYFAPPEFRSVLVPADAGARTLKPWEGMDQREVTGWFPELLSGLAWAGANRPGDDSGGGADVGAGIMTAEEVGGLDLKGCELAVLSACETGLGRVAGGEGVLGLQRAFHQAGCRTVLASLWKVDDAATMALMGRFYANLWEKGLVPLEALRQAQLSVLDDPDFGNGGDPRLWAAWTLSGDPGGLPRPAVSARPESKP